MALSACCKPQLRGLGRTKPIGVPTGIIPTGRPVRRIFLLHFLEPLNSLPGYCPSRFEVEWGSRIFLNPLPELFLSLHAAELNSLSLKGGGELESLSAFSRPYLHIQPILLYGEPLRIFLPEVANNRRHAAQMPAETGPP